MVAKRLILILFSISLSFFTFFSSESNEQVSALPALKILVVASYEVDNNTEVSQIRGFTDRLHYFSKRREIFYEKIYFYYMKGKYNKVTPEERTVEANRAYNYVKIINPDFVIVLDDSAKIYLSDIYLCNHHKLKILFGGINHHSTALYDNIAGIFEKVRVKEILDIFKTCANYDCKNVYVFLDGTMTGDFIFESISKEVPGIKFTPFRLSSLQDLRDFLSQLKDEIAVGSKEPVVLYNLAHRLSKSTGSWATVEEISENFFYLNRSYPDLAMASISCNFGVSSCEAIDFVGMGTDLGDMLIEWIYTGVKPKNRESKSYLDFNYSAMSKFFSKEVMSKMDSCIHRNATREVPCLIPPK